MNHREAEDNNIAEKYLRLELNPEEETAFEEHLISCEKCRELLKLLESTIDGLNNDIHEQFKTKKGVSKKSNWYSLPLVRVAAMIILLTGISAVFLYLRNNQAENRMQPVISEIIPDTATSDTEGAEHTRTSREDTSAVNKKDRTDLIAENFVPHPFYENLVEMNYRSAGIRIERPELDTLREKPVFSWKNIPEEKLTLVIINNREEIKFKEQIFNNTRLKINLSPGLYYWQLQNENETLFTGSFTYLPVTSQ